MRPFSKRAKKERTCEQEVIHWLAYEFRTGGNELSATSASHTYFERSYQYSVSFGLLLSTLNYFWDHVPVLLEATSLKKDLFRNEQH